MNKKNVITVLVFLSLGIALIYWQYNNISPADRTKIYQSIANAKWWYLVPAVVISFASHYFRALRWKMLLAPLQIKTRTVNTTLAVLIGYFVNLLVPRAGEVAKCTVLAKYEKAPVDKMLGTIVAERAFDTLCLGVFAFITLLLQYDIVLGYAQDLGQQFMNAFLRAPDGALKWNKLAVLLLIGIACVAGMVLLIKKTKNSAIGKILMGVWEGLKAIGKVKNKAVFIAYTIGIWLCYTLVVNVCFLALAPTAHVMPLASLSVIVFGSVAMIVTPGGIGAYPPIVASILMLYGIAFIDGTSFGWFSWLMQTVATLVFGLLSIVILFIYNNKNSDGTYKIGNRTA